jgi:DNA-directed RNA polymerase specialized sigma24 family protein
MGRSLRKTKLDGTPYSRRDTVETEIQELATLARSELERRAALWPTISPGFVSPEALVYFVRNLPDGAHREKLTAQVLLRVYHRVPRAADAGGRTASLTRMNIREDVVDHFVDLLLSDRGEYDDRLDYYEVNFNSAIARDRQDASRRHWTHENRSDELGSDEVEYSDRVEAAVGDYNPFDADELDKKSYRLLLDAAIDNLPELQRRIVEMLRQEIPIESKDASVVSISKALCKSEKTIRTHRDKAFASLRRRLEREGIV